MKLMKRIKQLSRTNPKEIPKLIRNYEQDYWITNFKSSSRNCKKRIPLPNLGNIKVGKVEYLFVGPYPDVPKYLAQPVGIDGKFQVLIYQAYLGYNQSVFQFVPISCSDASSTKISRLFFSYYDIYTPSPGENFNDLFLLQNSPKKLEKSVIDLHTKLSYSRLELFNSIIERDVDKGFLPRDFYEEGNEYFISVVVEDERIYKSINNYSKR